MNNQDYKTLVGGKTPSRLAEELENIKFKGFEAIDWEKVFMRAQIEEDSGLRIGLKTLIAMFLYLFIDRYYPIYDVKKNPNAKILFFHDTSERPGYVKSMYNAASLVLSDRMIAIEKKLFRFRNPIWSLKILFAYMPIWYASLRKTNLRLMQKVYIVRNLLSLLKLKEEFTSYFDINKYNLFVSHYDSLPEVAYLTQIFHINGKTTATLQHGAFTDFRANYPFELSGVELRTFNSDYILIWNKFTLDECKKVGFPLSACVLTGILGYIGQDKSTCTNPHNNTFGVVIGHPSLPEENMLLVKTANLLAQATGMSFKLKLHPNYPEDFFDKYVDKKYFTGIIKKGIPTLDYANQVEFSIIGSSSMFVELVFVNHDLIRLSTNTPADKYRDVTIGKIVHDPAEIVDVYEQNKGKNYAEELFDYLCTVRDVDAEYKKFFERFA